MASQNNNSNDKVSRRQILRSLAALGPAALPSSGGLSSSANAQTSPTPNTNVSDEPGPHPASWLPGGTPSIPFDTADDGPAETIANAPDIYQQLAALPRPRQHYQRYYNSREANENMWHAAQGIENFIRAYYHYKSADWAGNNPHPLTARSAEEWAKLPTYYIMDLGKGMAETVAEVMPGAAEIAANTWLPDAALKVCAEEYGRNSFQGGLQIAPTAMPDPWCF